MRSTALLLAAVAIALPAQADTIRLMTGPQGGVWVPLGGQMKAMWEKAVPGTTVQTLPGAGIANVKAIEVGKAEVGFGNSISTVDGVQGNAPFDGKTQNVCHLASLYPQYFQVVALADSGIQTIKDLKGKGIAAQPRGNSAEQITRDILKANGLAYENLSKVHFMSYTDAVSLLKDGHAHAFTLGTTIPASSVQDLATARDIRLLPVDDATIAAMKKINPGYTVGTVKANTYAKQAQDVRVITYATHLVASCKLPEAQVYAMTKAVHTGMKDMSSINAAMADTTAKEMAEDIGVPWHPGARRYFREIGAMAASGS